MKILRKRKEKHRNIYRKEKEEFQLEENQMKFVFFSTSANDYFSCERLKIQDLGSLLQQRELETKALNLYLMNFLGTKQERDGGRS